MERVEIHNLYRSVDMMIFLLKWVLDGKSYDFGFGQKWKFLGQSGNPGLSGGDVFEGCFSQKKLSDRFQSL